MMREHHGRAAAVIVTITGVLSAIAIPNLLEAVNRKHQKRTMADMRTIATAWEALGTDTNSFAVPLHKGSGKDLHPITYEELQRALIPTYIRTLPRLDDWGTAFEFRVGEYNDKGVAQTYFIRSLGSDRKAGTIPDNPRLIRGFHEDLIFTNGNFLQYPEGT